MVKQKIYFIPTYIGPLKHYERLIPYLKDKYDIGFLFVRKDSARRQEAIEYCQEKKYTFYVIDKGLIEDNRLRIPFFTPLKKRYEHSIACRHFLETIKPAKIISHKASSPYDTIFKEANRKGIETIVLQWSSDAGLLKRDKRRHTFVRKIYLYLLKALSGILDLFYKEPRYGYEPAIPKKIGVFYKEKAQYYLERGYNPYTIHVIGSPDLQLLYELKKKIDLDSSFKEELLKKYGLNKDKIKIFVILHRFYLVSDDKYKMTIEEHVAHYYNLFKMIREVFPIEDAEIILKLHPTENSMPEIYEPYKQLDVKLYYGESRTDELLCLSDLYIAEPASSVNYMAVGSGIPAIFVNFSRLQVLNERMKYFYIKHVVSDKGEFIDMLGKFKRGTLEKQYDNSSVNLNSVDKTIELIDK